MTPQARSLLAAAAGRMWPHADVLAETMVARSVERIPELGADPAAVELLTTSMVENVRAGLRMIETGTPLVGRPAPASALEYARHIAQRGVPVSALLRAYRLGQAGFQEHAIEQLSATAADADAVLSAARELSTISFGYVDDVAEQVVAAYQDERDHWIRSGATIRTTQVRSVLEDNVVSVADAEDALGYRLRQVHLGVILWTRDGIPRAVRPARLRASLRALVHSYGCVQEPLIVALDDSTLWAWLPNPRSTISTVDVEEEPGVYAAVGVPGDGIEGFRSTHQQASAARRVALAVAPPHRAQVTSWRAVGMLALMSTDLGALRMWTQRTLGDLAIADDAHARLRETLRALLAVQGSFTTAAASLGLHRNTVRYRVERATDILGPNWRSNRIAVEVALQASHVFGSAVLRPPG